MKNLVKLYENWIKLTIFEQFGETLRDSLRKFKFYNF